MSDLSEGEIAAIVIGVLVGLVLLVCFAILALHLCRKAAEKKKKKLSKAKREEESAARAEEREANREYLYRLARALGVDKHYPVDLQKKYEAMYPEEEDKKQEADVDLNDIKYDDE